MISASQGIGLGWLPDYPDFRDYTPEHEEVAGEMKKDKRAAKLLADSPIAAPPPNVDLRPWCPPIENQGAIGSCTANAGVGLVEYFERRAFGAHTDASRLFLYKATRNLLLWTGDTGAYLRTTMGALALFGVPPERYWPYVTPDFDREPPAFCYAFAQNYQAITYFRLDATGLAPDRVLERIKLYLVGHVPSMFGFTVYSSYTQANTTGAIPMPTSGDTVVGGHAVVAVGYDDTKRIKNTNTGGTETRGAFLIRNSWGSGWGQSGYGWLPYDYVLRGLAVDWWSVVKAEWIATGQFGF